MMDDKFPDNDETLGNFDFDDDNTTEDEIEEDFDEEFESDLSSSSSQEKTESKEDIPPLTTESLPPQESRPPPPTPRSGLIAPADIPVVLKVELDRLRMTADRLLNLRPGNFLTLQRTLEQEVDLVVNGEKIGRGELIRIGDVIGVRITELG